MFEVDVYKVYPNSAIITPLKVRREWMDNTKDKHAYHCMPLSMVNYYGWGIAFPKDISFIWNGNPESNPDNIKILSGEEYVYSDRGNTLITFKTGLMFKTPENLSLLGYPVPNYFVDGVYPLSFLLSTSFLKGDLQPSWKITKANEVITIKAGEPVIAVMPVDLSSLNESALLLKDGTKLNRSEIENDPEYTEYITKQQKMGIWPSLYRKAVDHFGNSIGKHQVRKISLYVKTIEDIDNDRKVY